MMISNGIEDEEKWLAEGIAGIQHNAFYLHRALVNLNMIIVSFSIPKKNLRERDVQP